MLNSLTTGVANTGLGWRSLYSNIDGNYNTAVGAGALILNDADSNTAVGAEALFLNTSGIENTAVGAQALLNNDLGVRNTAIGSQALANNTTGGANTAVGVKALEANTSGFLNVAIGGGALFSNTTADSNTAVGETALYNATGNDNTALGSSAGSNITTDNDNVCVGQLSGTNITAGSGNVCIGEGVSGELGVSNHTYIRNVNTLTQNFSAGVNDYVTVRLSDGRLGHTAVVSSQRYKEDIKPLAAASEALYGLKPVSFRLKKEYDETQALGFGLIAEEVEKLNPALVYCNNKGQVESVRYEMVNAMLLNEFIREHKKVQQLEASLVEQRKDFRAAIADLKKQMDAQIQKVSAQLEMWKPAAKVVVNKP